MCFTNKSLMRGFISVQTNTIDWDSVCFTNKSLMRGFISVQTNTIDWDKCVLYQQVTYEGLHLCSDKYYRLGQVCALPTSHL